MESQIIIECSHGVSELAKKCRRYDIRDKMPQDKCIHGDWSLILRLEVNSEACSTADAVLLERNTLFSFGAVQRTQVYDTFSGPFADQSDTAMWFGRTSWLGGGMGSGGASVFIVCLRRGSPATTPTSSGRTATPRAGCGVFGTIFVSGQGLHESPPSVTFHEKRPTVFEFGDRAPGLDTRRCTGQRRGCMGGPKGQNFPSGTLRRS